MSRTKSVEKWLDKVTFWSRFGTVTKRSLVFSSIIFAIIFVPYKLAQYLIVGDNFLIDGSLYFTNLVIWTIGLFVICLVILTTIVIYSLWRFVDQIVW